MWCEEFEGGCAGEGERDEKVTTNSRSCKIQEFLFLELLKRGRYGPSLWLLMVNEALWSIQSIKVTSKTNWYRPIHQTLLFFKHGPLCPLRPKIWIKWEFTLGLMSRLLFFFFFYDPEEHPLISPIPPAGCHGARIRIYATKRIY